MENSTILNNHGTQRESTWTACGRASTPGNPIHLRLPEMECRECWRAPAEMVGNSNTERAGRLLAGVLVTHTHAVGSRGCRCSQGDRTSRLSSEASGRACARTACESSEASGRATDNDLFVYTVHGGQGEAACCRAVPGNCARVYTATRCGSGTAAGLFSHSLASRLQCGIAPMGG